ncbi:hypothetical protein PtB15_6B463 [Puccinia triticina]|nr:hypothetical protein PtB15_6B463 [Puccinia triticina]
MLRNPGLISLTYLIFFINAIQSRVPGSSPLTNVMTRRAHSRLLPRKISDSNSHPQVIQDIHSLAGCPGEVCGTLAGDAVQPLLAGADECAQQDMADKLIDAAKSKLQDKAVQRKLIELAKIYRQTERNTFPDYSLPSTPDRNSLYCQKTPKNPELAGLFQKQSSSADPKLFFDPKSNGKSVQQGSDPRTKPLGGAKGQATPTNGPASTGDNSDDADGRNEAENGDDELEGTVESVSDDSPGIGSLNTLASNTRSPAEVQSDRELGVVQTSQPQKLSTSAQSSQASPGISETSSSTTAPLDKSAANDSSQLPTPKPKKSGLIS